MDETFSAFASGPPMQMEERFINDAYLLRGFKFILVKGVQGRGMDAVRMVVGHPTGNTAPIYGEGSCEATALNTHATLTVPSHIQFHLTANESTKVIVTSVRSGAFSLRTTFVERVELLDCLFQKHSQRQGDLDVSRSSIGELEVRCSSISNVSFKDSVCSGEIFIDQGCFKFEGDASKCRLRVETHSASVQIKDDGSGQFELCTRDGDVYLQLLGNGVYRVETASGNLSGYGTGDVEFKSQIGLNKFEETRTKRRRAMTIVE